MIARILTFLTVLTLAACGTGTAPPAPPGVLFAPNFRDA